MTDSPAPDIDQTLSPGLLRRLAALLYDSMLLAAVLFLAAIPPTLLLAPEGGDGKHVQAAFYSDRPLLEAGFYLYILFIIFIFFGWFWTHGGQTLGMRVWRMQMIREDGQGLSLKDAGRRLLMACLSLAPLGLGLLWTLFDRDNLAWHDRWSRTRPVLVAKKSGKRPDDPA